MNKEQILKSIKEIEIDSNGKMKSCKGYFINRSTDDME